MNMTGAQLVRYALEQLGVRFTFGIPGVHNTEIYDQLASSEQITPIRVVHEGNGAFMADAISRTSHSPGTLVMVPAAGTALAYAGIGEAFLAGIPMLVVTGGVRTDHQFGYQLHEIDQLEMVRPITKGRWRVMSHAEIVPTLFEAWRVATEGEPGPVFVEIPANLQMFPAPVAELPPLPTFAAPPAPEAGAIEQAAALLAAARHPGLFLGWGARDATAQAIALAERLNAPVATTLQGLSVFPATHPLHVGMGIGPAAVPAAVRAFADCDVLLAVGNRFSEIATGSFGIDPHWKLIHIDLNPKVFNVNYPAQVTIAADAGLALDALLGALQAAAAPAVVSAPVEAASGAEESVPAAASPASTPVETASETEENAPAASSPASALTDTALRAQIALDKQRYLDEWLRHDNGDRVNPARFFQALRRQLADDAYLLVDDGNHTYLMAELFQATRSKHVFSPTDFNCMGYCVPAAIGVKLAHPQSQVAGVVGDGAFLMTGLEILTATEHWLGIVYYVFNDGELSQISQVQALPYNRKTCTVLPEVRLRGIAEAVGAAYFEMNGDEDIERVIADADARARDGQPVIVDVHIDYSKPTRFTQGVVKTTLKRMSLRNRLRLFVRALWRRIRGMWGRVRKDA